MSQMIPVKLQLSCIKNVPFENYAKDFSFIVNDKEFKTSKIVSDLISPYISKIHSIDPTFDRFVINTKGRGDFSQILKLINFETNKYEEEELPFLIEVIEQLNNEFIEIEENTQKREITISNVFDNFQQHEKHSNFYQRYFLKEIEFISSHFTEIYETKEEELSKLSIDTLYLILNHDQLQVKNEDEVLKFINKLYTTDDSYSILYETVLFENVTSSTIIEFIKIYDIEHLTHNTWKRLNFRLSKEIHNDRHDEQNSKYQKRYKMKSITFSKDKEFDGIIKYLRKKSNKLIENEINITSSSLNSNDSNYQPQNVTLFDDNDKHFESEDKPNSWLCFDLKKHRIIPTDYTIRSCPWSPNNNHPKSWVIECSNDNKSWETVDEEKDCSYLNGASYSHTFTMNHQKSTEFRYIRIRLTGTTWHNQNYLKFCSFEIYGQLNYNL